MNKFGLVAVAVAAFGIVNNANAADMPTKAPIVKAPVAVPFTWTGFYIGGHAGYGWSNDTDILSTDPTASGPFAPISMGTSGKNAVAGIHAGYNWQFAPSWLIGIEGDWSWAGIKESDNRAPVFSAGGTPCFNGPPSLCSANSSVKINSLSSLRGRLGYATPNWLLYATGGIAWADMHFTGDVICPVPNCIGPGEHAPVDFSKTRTGWVLGGGVDYRPWANNWIIGVEYLNYHFKGDDNAGGAWVALAGGAPVGFGGCAPGALCQNYKFGAVGVQTLRGRLSYKF